MDGRFAVKRLFSTSKSGEQFEKLSVMKKTLFLIAALFSVACGGDVSDFVPAVGQEVSVVFSLCGVSADASGQVAAVPARSRADVTPENLVAGTTVRVVAYKRRAGAASADMGQDTYVCDVAYCVSANGSLTPCSVDSEGKNTGTSGVSAMRLLAGTYDFYACTPALPLAADHRSVSVPHGVDYACSATLGRTIAAQAAATSQGVVLETLLRRCSRLCFSVTRKAENVTKVRINSVSLGRIAHSPASASLGSALPLGANDGSYVFPADAFVQGDQPYKYSGFDEVLPKSSAAFDLAMQVVFNDAGKPADLKAEIPAMAFAPGLRYTFDLSLQGGFIVLTLQVTPWNTDAVWDTAFGDPPYASVTVGTWEITGWTTDIGGHFVPQVDPASWSANHSLSPELGL